MKNLYHRTKSINKLFPFIICVLKLKIHNKSYNIIIVPYYLKIYKYILHRETCIFIHIEFKYNLINTFLNVIVA